MRRLLVIPAVVVLLLAPAGCGGHPGDLRHTCDAVAQAWPGDLYDDHANAAFAKRLDRILAQADPRSRRTFRQVQRAMHLTVAAIGDNTAVTTESVEVLAALEPVNRACSRAGGATIR